MGRVRPRRAHGRRAGVRGPRRSLARDPRRDPGGGARAGVRRRLGSLHPGYGTRSSTRACSCSRSSASCPRPTRACAARSRRSSATFYRTASFCGTARVTSGWSATGKAGGARPNPRVDGLPRAGSAGEGVFLPCSFWLVDCYELLGRHDEAHALFEQLIGLANDVGLLAEEYDPKTERYSGTSRRRSRTLRSSTRRSTCCRICRRRCTGGTRPPPGSPRRH